MLEFLYIVLCWALILGVPLVALLCYFCETVDDWGKSLKNCPSKVEDIDGSECGKVGNGYKEAKD